MRARIVDKFSTSIRPGNWVFEDAMVSLQGHLSLICHTKENPQNRFVVEIAPEEVVRLMSVFDIAREQAADVEKTSPETDWTRCRGHKAVVACALQLIAQTEGLQVPIRTLLEEAGVRISDVNRSKILSDETKEMLASILDAVEE